jgi:prepilin-type N-terminal cleavage/methylation domain-containing protein
MDKPFWNSGFTLIEILLVLIIVFVLGSIAIRPIDFQFTKVHDFQSEFLHTQFIALKTHTDQTLDTAFATDYPIRFKPNGNVNMGQTIQIGQQTLVILIGTGRIHEKSIYDD